MKIAVLIPSYQSAKTIVATIRSIGEQTALSRLSGVYLADDCSTDNSISLVNVEWTYSIPLHVICGRMNLGERGNVNNALGGNVKERLLVAHIGLCDQVESLRAHRRVQSKHAAARRLGMAAPVSGQRLGRRVYSQISNPVPPTRAKHLSKFFRK